MKLRELLDKYKNKDLEKIGIYIGSRVNRVNCVSCWEENGNWIMQEIDDKQKPYITSGNEEEIMNLLDGIISLMM